jgi:hypothetical protein
MTVQLTTAVASRDRTAPAQARHRHDRACFWDVDECRWQCGSYPLVRHALERGTVATAHRAS